MNRISYFILFAIILLASCSKEKILNNKQEGIWNINYIEIYGLNITSNDFELQDVINEPGTIDFKNEKAPKGNKGYVYNVCIFNLDNDKVIPTSLLSILSGGDGIYWSAKAFEKTDFWELQLLSSDYVSYSVEWIDENEQIWYFFRDENEGFDGKSNYKEIWKLIR